MIRTGELSARELVEKSLRRIDALEPQVNAFTHVAHDAALAAADEIGAADPRPFAGVPIAVKDNRPVAGMPITMCSDLFGDTIAHHDAFLVRRLREPSWITAANATAPAAMIGLRHGSAALWSGRRSSPW